MFNVILVDIEGNEYFVGSNGIPMNGYSESRKLIYEFEDYEDANNVIINFIEDNSLFDKNNDTIYVHQI